jgi:hypothetical protein
VPALSAGPDKGLLGLFGRAARSGQPFTTLVQALQARRVAELMRGRGAATAAAAGESAADRSAPLVRPPLRLAFLAEEDLPVAGPYLARVEAERNVLGLPPVKILYLYNFYAAETLQAKMEGGWRRFGPTFFLASPADVAVAHALSLDMPATVARLLLADEADFDGRFAAALAAPASPAGAPDLTDAFHVTGAYPQHAFLCTDANWRHAVDVLIDHADVVLVDASGYSAERAGLGWEIGQLVNRKASARLVVLVDEAADQVALASAFDAAWDAMSPASPNNAPDPAALAIVLLQDPEDEADLSGPRVEAALAPVVENLSSLSRSRRDAISFAIARLARRDGVFALLAQSL